MTGFYGVVLISDEKFSLWSGSFFPVKSFIAKSTGPIQKRVYRITHYAIIYLFSLKIPVNVCEKLPHRFVSYRVLIDWFNFCRKITSMYLGGSPVKLGGKGKTVKIDKSKFGKKRKYNEGKVPNPGFWVLWIVNSWDRQTLQPLRSNHKKVTIPEEAFIPRSTTSTGSSPLGSSKVISHLM